MDNIKRFIAATIPNICLLCDQTTAGWRPICHECSTMLPAFAASSVCKICGRGLLQHRSGICGACLRRPPEFSKTIAAYPYRYPITVLVRALKYKQKIAVAKAVGDKLADEILLQDGPLPDCIIPVPLHIGRLLERGFNQAHEICRVLARRLNIKIDHRLLSRARPTEPQFSLSAKARKQNIRGAFKINRAPEYQSVAIVDDIVTTGTTVNELAWLLKSAGVKQIEVWTCARTI